MTELQFVSSLKRILPFQYALGAKKSQPTDSFLCNSRAVMRIIRIQLPDPRIKIADVTLFSDSSVNSFEDHDVASNFAVYEFGIGCLPILQDW